MSPQAGVDVYAARSDGWHALRDAAVIGGPGDPPPDLTGYFLLSTPGTNPLATIQTALDTHGKVALRDVAEGGAANWNCNDSLLMSSDQGLYVGNGVNLWKTFNATTATSQGFIRNRTFTGTRMHDVDLWGPGNIAAKSGCQGNILSLMCDRLWSSGWTTSYYMRHCMISGDDIVMQDHNWRVDTNSASGGAGLRFAGGANFIGRRLNVISGDDTFQIVPAGAPSDPMWNMGDATNTLYEDCVGQSLSARVIAVGLQDSNNGANVNLGMNVAIKDALFQRIKGFGGGSEINIANHSSLKTIERINFHDVEVDCRNAVGTTGQQGECYVQRENAGCGIVDHVNYGGFGSYNGVKVYNKRSGKFLLYVSDDFGGVTNIGTPNTGVGNLVVPL